LQSLADVQALFRCLPLRGRLAQRSFASISGFPSPPRAGHRSGRFRRCIAPTLCAGDRRGAFGTSSFDASGRLAPENLVASLLELGIDPVTVPPFEMDALSLAWRQLDPWSDSVSGLTRLKRRFIIAPLSNGNIRLMLDLAKHGRLPWDAILGAEIAQVTSQVRTRSAQRRSTDAQAGTHLFRRGA
jgi:hypothetical protein